jgi:sigma-E factor negative regulatory protein RseB
MIRGVELYFQAMLAGLLLLGTQVGAASGLDPNRDAKVALARMTQSLRTLSYTGTFIYLHGNRLDTLQFSHVVRNGQELERLVSLNGAAREVHRDPKAVTCVMPDVKAVSVKKRPPTTELWPSLDMTRLEQFYRLHALGDYRVAGRMAQVVGIIPRDKLRYGYRFYLDQDTGLPLKTDLMNEEANPVEQIMFTSLGLDTELSQPTGSKGHLGGYRTVLRNTPQTGRRESVVQWEFVGLPPGFKLRDHHHWSDAAGAQGEQLVLTDGLASVSVYVEQGDSEGLQGPAHEGAVNAWGGRIAGYQVTAVGEVPSGTVQQVAEALRRRPMGGDK